MTKPEVLKHIRSSGLPEELKRYFENIVNGKLSFSLKIALRRNAGDVTGNIDRLLTAASSILARSKDEVLFTTGFNVHNASPERFEAALAEIRAAVFLHDGGFKDIDLIGPGMKKTADLRGTLGNKKYVFEVCCIQTTGDLTRVDYLRDKSGALRKFGKKPVDYLELKYDKKMLQVKSSRKEYDCAGGGLIFVVDPSGPAAFAQAPELKQLARELYERKNRPQLTHICILSGANGCVYPDWR